MKRYIFSLAALVTFACFGFGPTGVAAADYSALRVPHGTGFVFRFGSSRFFATAGHVADSWGRRELATFNPTSRIAGRDIAIFSVPSEWKIPEGILEYEIGPRVKPGDIVLLHTLSGVREARVEGFRSKGRFNFAAKLCAGESGSPILNGAGQLVGIGIERRVRCDTCTGCARCGPGVAVDVSILPKFLRERLEKPEEEPPSPPQAAPGTIIDVTPFGIAIKKRATPGPSEGLKRAAPRRRLFRRR